MSDPWDEFDPSRGTRSYLRWARSHGAETLGDAYDLLEQFEFGNDVPEVLGEDDTVDVVRSELEEGLESAGADQGLSSLL
ncbi:MAG: hypothetical protein U0Q15_04145 [Kineosporiaceae bacterium]